MLLYLPEGEVLVSKKAQSHLFCHVTYCHAMHICCLQVVWQVAYMPHSFLYACICKFQTASVMTILPCGKVMSAHPMTLTLAASSKACIVTHGMSELRPSLNGNDNCEEHRS